MDNLDELLDDLVERKSFSGGNQNRVASSRVDLDELENLMNDLKGEPESAKVSNAGMGGGDDLDDLMSSLGAPSSNPSMGSSSSNNYESANNNNNSIGGGDGDLDDLMNSLNPSTAGMESNNGSSNSGGGDGDLDDLMNSLTPSNPSVGGSNSSGGGDLDDLMNSLTPSNQAGGSGGMDLSVEKNNDIFDLLGGGGGASNNQSSAASGSQPAGPAGQTNLSELETDILMELQRLRSDPTFYANLLENRMKPGYRGKWLVMKTDSNQMVQMETIEGVVACDEAIQVLRQIGSIGSISHGKGLSDAAREAVTEHGKYGEMKSSALERLMNYGKFEGQASEMVSYGIYSAQEVIMQHLVSDGDPNRGNRKTMLDHQRRYVGIGVSTHKSQYQRMYSLVFANDWMDWSSLH